MRKGTQRAGKHQERTKILYLVFFILLVCLATASFAQTTPTITLTSSVNPGINGQAVSFTATVSGGSGAAIPKGTVTFLDSGTALYFPVTLNATGAAVFTSSNLSVATHSITARYSGDNNYSAVTSSALSEVIVPAPASDYTLTASVLTQTVEVGSSTTYSLTITPTNGYNGTITFTCSGLPLGTGCAFNPSSLTPNGTETDLITSVRVTTTGNSSALRTPANPKSENQYALLTSLGGLFGAFVFLGNGRRKRIASLRSQNWARIPLLGLLAATIILSFSSCGGSSSSTSGSTTPIGTQTFTANATGTAGTNGGNTSVHQISLTLIVTAATS